MKECARHIKGACELALYSDLDRAGIPCSRHDVINASVTSQLQR